MFISMFEALSRPMKNSGMAALDDSDSSGTTALRICSGA